MIEVENLDKRYGSLPAVSDVSFRCTPGTVTGFVGPNGAGKSTTLRMICGLAEASSGRATVLGAAYRSIPNPGRHVGVLLDAGAQHGGRTGEETLTIAAMTVGVGGERVAAVLEAVGLAGKPARKRVRTYSLGMRQRLGIAHALLGDPQVPILDEPANGLDPQGIVWGCAACCATSRIAPGRCCCPRTSCTVAPGECVALVGANGSGKSTAVRAISGLLQPSTGTVRVCGHDPHREPDAERARAALALVPDTPVLYEDLSVRQHLQLVA